MEKQELRRIVRERKKQYSQEQLSELSCDIVSRLLPILENAETILLYYSLQDEVCTHTLIRMLKGKTILLPFVLDNENMELRVYAGENSMRQGAYNIMEPCGEAFTDYESIDVSVIPGMAFDSKNNRLGRGKGYYDRLLPKIPNTRKVGVCFPFQLFEEIPAEATDVKMDCVIC